MIPLSRAGTRADEIEVQQLAGFWPDIDKSRAEARRLLKEAGADNLSFELLTRDVKGCEVWARGRCHEVGGSEALAI